MFSHRILYNNNNIVLSGIIQFKCCVFFFVSFVMAELCYQLKWNSQLWTMLGGAAIAKTMDIKSIENVWNLAINSFKLSIGWECMGRGLDIEIGRRKSENVRGEMWSKGDREQSMLERFHMTKTVELIFPIKTHFFIYRSERICISLAEILVKQHRQPWMWREEEKKTILKQTRRIMTSPKNSYIRFIRVCAIPLITTIYTDTLTHTVTHTRTHTHT